MNKKSINIITIGLILFLSLCSSNLKAKEKIGDQIEGHWEGTISIRELRQHESYYQQQIESYKEKVPVTKMWVWLENQFPIKYDNYIIIISPLIIEANNTKRLDLEGSKLCLMFVSVSGLNSGNSVNKALTEAILSRTVFTEIDHNYVNPITDSYLPQVNEALSDLSRWNEDKRATQAYNSAYATINEYLTWAVYLLYAYDHYDNFTFKDIENHVNRQMDNSRDFIRFSSFSEFCLELYKNKPNDKKISDLFPEMIEWFRVHNNEIEPPK